MRHKKALALLLAALLLVVATCAYAADALTITTGSFPRGKLGQAYSAQLSASGGSGTGYQFTLLSGNLPEGLTFSEPDGTLSGVPRESGRFGSMLFRVTDSEGNTRNKRVAVSIDTKIAEFEIGANYFMYDGQPHTVAVTPVPSDIKADDYQVRYNGAESQTDVGTYVIAISGEGLISKGYEVGDFSPHVMVITDNDSTAVSLNSQSILYDGKPHGLTPTVTPTEIADKYTITYQDAAGNVLDNLPVNVGTYTVTVTTNAPNYAVRTARATLTITAPKVNFDVTDAAYTYDGGSHTATVNPKDSQLAGEYTVTYDNTATTEVEELTSVSDAGTYKINITFPPNSNKELGTMTTDMLVIAKRTVKFAVTNNTVTYDGNPHKATVTTDAALAESEYTVTYGTGTDTEVSAAGTYAIKVALSEEAAKNYELGTVSPAQLVIDPLTVNFTVTNNTVTYDGSPHSATVTPDVAPDVTVPASAYTVTYGTGTDTEVTDAGTYAIVVTMADDNYDLGTVTPAQLVIDPLTVNFTITNNTATYDSNPHAATVTPDVAPDGMTLPDGVYTVTYGAGADTEVTDAGTYAIVITMNNGNYALGTMTANELVIDPLTVDFTVSDNDYYFEENGEYQATVTPDGVTLPDGAYTVGYKLGEAAAVAKAAAPGEYAVVITMTDGNYALGNVANGTLTVRAKTGVTVTLSNNKQVYDPAKTDPYTATVTLDPALDASAYTVTYHPAADPDGAAIDVTEQGSYIVKVTITQEGYYLAGYTDNDNTFTVAAAELTLGRGNSIAAHLADEAALAQFAADHIYDGVKYDPAAWGAGANLDEDATAYFMFEAMLPPELPYTASHADGTAVDAADVTLQIGGQTPADWLAAEPQLGVYDMTYSFTDKLGGNQVTAVRKLVYLPLATGDTNGDRNINIGDARWLEQVIAAADNNDLYLYRVCDVNHDGTVDTQDVKAIISRMNTPIVPYYAAIKNEAIQNETAE